MFSPYTQTHPKLNLKCTYVFCSKTLFFKKKTFFAFNIINMVALFFMLLIVQLYFILLLCDSLLDDGVRLDGENCSICVICPKYQGLKAPVQALVE